MGFSGEVGLIYIKALKNKVAELRFKGYDVDLWLSSGLLSKNYTVKGADAQLVWNWLEALQSQ